jgi:hypothetical protein
MAPKDYGGRMAKRTRGEAVIADASLEQAKKSGPLFKKLLTVGMGSRHDHGMSVREVHYKGRHIVIKTTYEIKVDGRKFDAALGVSDKGQVHYHGMPNVAFDSAIDLMKSVIDQFPEAFSKKAVGKEPKDSHRNHGEARRKIARGTKARSASK